MRVVGSGFSQVEPGVNGTWFLGHKVDRVGMHDPPGKGVSGVTLEWNPEPGEGIIYDVAGRYIVTR